MNNGVVSRLLPILLRLYVVPTISQETLNVYQNKRTASSQIRDSVTTKQVEAASEDEIDRLIKVIIIMGT